MSIVHARDNPDYNRNNLACTLFTAFDGTRWHLPLVHANKHTHCLSAVV